MVGEEGSSSVWFWAFSLSECHIHTLNDHGLNSFLSQSYHSVQSEWLVGSFPPLRT